MKKLKDYLRSSFVVFGLLVSAIAVNANAGANAKIEGDDLDPHAAVFAKTEYPSASECQSCHAQIYAEWSSSAHAYAGLSPMFHKFEQKINDLAPTIGNFCVRCHQSVGTTQGDSRDTNFWDREPVATEGVTCVTCHRVNVPYGKANGERRMEPGSIFEPVYGAAAENELDRVIKEFPVSTEADGRGRKIHRKTVEFEQLKDSQFCVSCHQVAVNLGIKLEVVWDQYRASPAHAQGHSCQSCHMGRVPGIPSGYERGPVAIVNGEAIEPEREHHNHNFYGPGYSIAHLGLFPQNPKAKRWSIKDWLLFDEKAGWGTDEFENSPKAETTRFPAVWADSFDRADAREIIEQNRATLAQADEWRSQVMENGTHVDGPFFESDQKVGKALKFYYDVKNINSGHNVPSGSLGAQPEIWLNVALVGPDGYNLWESGYVDQYGDMADLHSQDVREGKIPHDDQLFNLQTKFLTTNVKGTDREMYLPVNIDIDPLPFLRSPQQPVTVMNHPPLVRMEGRSIPPLGTKRASYKIPGGLLKQKGTYKLAVRLRSRAEPIYFMKFVGATMDMQEAMNAGMIDVHPYTVEFEVK